MKREALKVHLEAIMEDTELSSDARFCRIAVLARQYLEGQESANREVLFDDWNSVVAEVVHKHIPQMLPHM